MVSTVRFDAFLPKLDPLVRGGMVTLERVEVLVYRSEDAKPGGTPG